MKYPPIKKNHNDKWYFKRNKIISYYFLFLPRNNYNSYYICYVQLEHLKKIPGSIYVIGTTLLTAVKSWFILQKWMIIFTFSLHYHDSFACSKMCNIEIKFFPGYYVVFILPNMPTITVITCSINPSTKNSLHKIN